MVTHHKSAIFSILVALSAFLFWSWVKPWIVNPFQVADTNLWLKPLISLCVLAGLIGLSFLLIKNRWFRLAVSILAGLPFLMVFDFNNYYFIALVLIVSLHGSAAAKISKQAGERTKIDIREIMGHGLPSVITPILLLVSFAFFFSPGLQASAARQELPPTVHEVISRIVVGLLGGELEKLPPEDRRLTEKALAERVFEQFNQILDPYFKFLPPILAFSLFLILQGLSFIFVWLGTLIAMLLFWVFKKAGLVRLKLVQKEAEELEF